MNREDWLVVGCKLLGVYFGIQGLMSLVYFLVLSIQGAAFQGVWDRGLSFMQWRLVLQPFAYLLVAWLLTRRTRWCVGWLML